MKRDRHLVNIIESINEMNKGGKKMRRVMIIATLFFLSFFQLPVCQAQQTMDTMKLLKKIGGVVLGEEKKAGALTVQSKPQGAFVYVDGILKGKTPLTLDEVTPGKLEVQVELPGYATEKKQIEIKPGEKQVASFYLVSTRPAPSTGVRISADPAGSSAEGSSVTFMAAGAGGTGKYEYRFLKKGPATGGRWNRMQEYSSSNIWTWFPKGADVGTNQIAIHVRSAGSGTEKEAEKVMTYVINPVKPRIAPATGIRISADPVSPNPQGTTVAYMAAGVGGTGRYEYRFFKKGPATGDKWAKVQDYSPKNIWIWKTSGDDVGSSQIAVQVRNAGSDAYKEVEKIVTYIIKPVSVRRTARLYVHPDPTDAKVRILNIKPPYEWGIILDAGWYHLQVSKQGYKTKTKWVELVARKDKQLNIALEKTQVEKPYDLTNCSSGTITMVSESKDLTVYGIDEKGITRSNHANKVLGNMTFHCVGVVRTMGGKTLGNGYCKFADPDGEHVVTEFAYSGEKGDGTWNYLQGTGKWKGITGGGKYRRVTSGKPITPGTVQNCVRATGSFTLPK